MKNVPRIALVYDRRKRATVHNPQPVEIRITIGKKQTFHNTGVRLLPNEWKGETVINRADAYELNEKISILRRHIERTFNQQIEEGKPVDVKGIDLAKEDRPYFIDFCKERASIRPVKESTREKYNAFIKRLVQWGGIKTFDDVTSANITAWNDFICSIGRNKTQSERKKKEKTERPFCQATIYNYNKWMKLFINDAISMGLIKENPYNAFRGKIPRGDKELIEYLTEEELMKIRETGFSTKTYEVARDLFLFQCYTGLPYVELTKFDISTYTLEEGKYFKMDKRTKTDKKFAIQLLSPAVKILEKYDMKLPKLCNADYNRRLKIVAAQAGIKKNLHSHMGRSTFATFMLSHGTPLHIVSKMLGHTNTKQTLKYADILASDVKVEFNKIETLLS